jgi:hypothetical protein
MPIVAEAQSPKPVRRRRWPWWLLVGLLSFLVVWVVGDQVVTVAGNLQTGDATVSVGRHMAFVTWTPLPPRLRDAFRDQPISLRGGRIFLVGDTMYTLVCL